MVDPSLVKLCICGLPRIAFIPENNYGRIIEHLYLNNQYMCIGYVIF